MKLKEANAALQRTSLDSIIVFQFIPEQKILLGLNHHRLFFKNTTKKGSRKA